MSALPGVISRGNVFFRGPAEMNSGAAFALPSVLLRNFRPERQPPTRRGASRRSNMREI